jgi:protein-disulfide isomerase
MLVVVFCVVVVVSVKLTLAYLKPELSQASYARGKGNPQAPVQVTEFMDFQCPACANGSLFLSQYVQKYPDRLYLQVKHFPLTNVHSHAFRSARYAECAARQGKFWDYHDRLVARQEEWARLINADVVFQQIAQEIGLDFKQLESCLQDETIQATILKDKADGESRGVESTPTYFVNGKMVVGTKSLNSELLSYFGEAKN